MTRLRRIATGILALVVLAGLVGGIPYALWHFVGWPLPHHLPSGSALLHDLDQRGIPDRTLVDALAVVVWLTWGVLVASLVAEVPAAIRGERAGRLPLAGIFQPLTGRLVAAVLVAALAVAPRPTTGRTGPVEGLATLAPRPVAAVVLTNASAPLDAAAVHGRGDIGTGAELQRCRHAQRRRGPMSSSAATRSGASQSRELGDPLRWREIAELNEDRVEGTRRFTDPHWIYPGWTLLLPAEPTSDARHPGVPRPNSAPPRQKSAPAPTETTTPKKRAATAPASSKEPQPSSGPTTPPAGRTAASGSTRGVHANAGHETGVAKAGAGGSDRPRPARRRTARPPRRAPARPATPSPTGSPDRAADRFAGGRRTRPRRRRRQGHCDRRRPGDPPLRSSGPRSRGDADRARDAPHRRCRRVLPRRPGIGAAALHEQRARPLADRPSRPVRGARAGGRFRKTRACCHASSRSVRMTRGSSSSTWRPVGASRSPVTRASPRRSRRRSRSSWRARAGWSAPSSTTSGSARERRIRTAARPSRHSPRR